MNQKLTEEIAYHVLSNLGVLPSDFVNFEKTKSITSDQFILPEKMTFETTDGKVIRNKVYGCQIAVTPQKEFKLLLADCTQEKNVPEYCLFIQLKGAPAFAVYLIFNRLVEDPPESEALISVSMDKKFWMPCTVYLQATFLAGIEQLRDLGHGWAKCLSYREEYEHMLNFIKFHDSYFSGGEENEEDEGKEV